jgi:hypothetical protein
MNRLFTTGLLVGLTIAMTQMQAHAAESKQCYAHRASYLVGEYLTRTVLEQARAQARAAKVIVNPVTQEFEPDRLKIITDLDLKITGMSCG